MDKETGPSHKLHNRARLHGHGVQGHKMLWGKGYLSRGKDIVEYLERVGEHKRGMMHPEWTRSRRRSSRERRLVEHLHEGIWARRVSARLALKAGPRLRWRRRRKVHAMRACVRVGVYVFNRRLWGRVDT